ncbi:UNVERIFIED_CONTAM: hypothetical protein HDU68_007881 [Siphonaria sp. JEL0065]|nr:hypothetical protein HDU68_007881 [Siphonaria sp. JEL0065]
MIHQLLVGGGFVRTSVQGPTVTTVLGTQPPDLTKVIDIQKLRRLLLIVFNWWYPLRQWLPDAGMLPERLDEAFLLEISNALQANEGDKVELIAVGTKIVDTLEREGGFAAVAA